MTRSFASQITSSAMRACALAIGLGGGLSAPVLAQATLSEQVVDSFNIEPEAPYGLATGSFVIAPIPLIDPTLGTGLVLGAGYLFNSDADSSSSYFGIGALGTDLGSTGYGFASKIFLDSNRWQFGLSAGKVDLKYDLFVLGTPVPLDQSGSLVQASFAYGFTPEFSLGIDARYLESKIKPTNASPNSLPSNIFKALDTEILNLGIVAKWDRRDDTIFPTSGTLVDLQVKHGEILSGLASNYGKATFRLNGYTQALGQNVIAGTLAACSATDAAPFYDSCALGGSDSFRGFPVTQYIDSNLMSLQVAWRGRITERFGYAVFAGAGAVAGSFNALDSAQLHKAAGLGVRYRLSKKFPLEFAVDGTINDEDDRLVYLYVGQRF